MEQLVQEFAVAAGMTVADGAIVEAVCIFGLAQDVIDMQMNKTPEINRVIRNCIRHLYSGPMKTHLA